MCVCATCVRIMPVQTLALKMFQCEKSTLTIKRPFLLERVEDALDKVFEVVGGGKDLDLLAQT